MAVVSCGGNQSGQTSGLHLDNLDTTVAPGADFYRYACGGWMENNPLGDQYARFGSFDQLAETNTERINGLIEDIASRKGVKGDEAKVGMLYNIAMDSVKLNADGMAPIASYLQRIDAVTDNTGLQQLVAVMMREAFDPYFFVFASVDEKNSTKNLLQIYQSGLTLGNRDYYLSDDENNRNIREKYVGHIGRMFSLAGFDEESAKKASESVMRVETALAGAHFDNLTLRDPYRNYHKMPYQEFVSRFPGMDWDSFMSVLGADNVDTLNVSQLEPLAKAVELITEGNIDDQKNYLKWKVIDAAAPYLSDAFVAENFEFYGKVISGQKEIKPRWKRAVATVDGVLGEEVGRMYVEKYFPPRAKERMITLIDNLKKSLGERISALEWMSDSTKEKALEKLSTFYVKVGYPDKWRDYSALEIKNDSYFANIVRASVFEYDYLISKAGKPVDRTEWHMTPQTVNAYYNPTTNEICFPAGILQYPFFDMDADDAFNYGAIGVVIGHEMTHGFDDQGRLYDKNGNLADWWSQSDADNFKARAQVLVDWFDAIEVLPGLYANGSLTLGENIADFGGIQVAFQAFRNATASAPLPVKDGFTPEQRFFIAYANLWATNIRDEQIRYLTQMDVHSLGEWRVNAILPHVQAWYDAFGIVPEDGMYLAPENRASIW
ncbi:MULTISPECIES: M13 family metallopeptidase [unclassified Muribaculum]|uniref:M13 family metallopeptidase n=1 Tax=unclassified Muribaculum TaxID=2622126 RepID=UPI001EF67928|nr:MULTISPECIES: M13 family metallopeptidase [unclassified Muribaculum]